MMRAAPGMGSDEVAAMLAGMAANNPFGRLGRPEDIAETVAFLASDGAAYITGQEIVVSGGAGLAV
jgi:NAD(P)-dependent dehydrogenase (short-subunit alcohol dehydrogenase family)